MGKFINLVKNEYIKLFTKASTWVILIILMVSTVGLSALALISQKQKDSSNDSDEIHFIESYESEINYLKEVKTQGWEKEVDLNQYMIDNLITDEWSSKAADVMFDIKYDFEYYGIKNVDEIINSIDNSIKTDDWKVYFDIAVDLSDEYPELIDNSEGIINLYKYCLAENVSPYKENWKYELASNLESEKANLALLKEQQKKGLQIDSDSLKELEKSCIKHEYQLENNIDFDVSENISWMSNGEFNFWSVFGTSILMLSFISVIVIIIAGGIISSEFSSGTIKFLMINPVKRWKILLSKYFTSISFGFLLMILVYIVSILSTMIFFGADHIGNSYISVSGDSVKEISGFLYVAKVYLLNSINFIVMGSLAFSISSLFRSSALAIGISVMALFGGNTLLLILRQLQFDWGRYLIFSNLDIISISEGSSYFIGQTVLSAVIVIAVHMFIFLLTAWDGFTKREI